MEGQRVGKLKLYITWYDSDWSLYRSFIMARKAFINNMYDSSIVQTEDMDTKIVPYHFILFLQIINDVTNE